MAGAFACSFAQFDEAVPRMSPDGRFVLYQSRETDRWQIYIAPFAPTRTPTPIGWDVTPDGQRFLVNGCATEEPRQQPLTLVQNFGNVLRAAEKQAE
ncbi:MAG TPA: hypothetical protein VF846_19840 [Thermoanaerobaculia bacterium]